MVLSQQRDWVKVTSSAGFSDREDHSSVVFDNKMWVIAGGEKNSNNLYTAKNDVWYSSDGSTWTQATSSAAFSARMMHTSIVFDGKMWVIGGQTTNRYFENNKFDDVWYSSDGITWTEATSSAAFGGRSEHNSVVFDNKMWVIAGRTSSAELNDVWYSSDGVTWTSATSSAAFPKRYTASAHVFNNKMWIIGGNQMDLGDVWYSSDGENWSEAVDPADFGKRGFLTSLSFDSKMWVIGGRDGSGVHQNDVWYSSNGVNWSEYSTSTTFLGRSNHTSIVFQDRIWVIAGGPHDSYNDVWSLNDITAPTVTSVSSTADNGTYGIGSVIPITVTFDESVIVTGTPQLTLETGDTDAVVDYSSGSGSSILTFNYTVASGNTSGDLDYGSTSALALNSGTIKDAVGNDATLTLASPAATNSLGANKDIVIDTVKPTVSSVTSTTDDGSYTEGGTVVVTVTFNEAVTVSGTPQLTLETGDTDAVVDYSSGSGTTILSFNYIVASGHGSSDLGYTSTTALSLNSGTINDSGGNAAVLTLPTPGAANSLSANKAILVDGGKPVVSAVSESPGVFRNTSFQWSSEGWGADFIDPFNLNNDFTIQLWVKYIGPEEWDHSININLNTTLNLGIMRTRTTFWWTNNNDGSELYGDIHYQFGNDKSHLNSSGILAKDKWYHITLQKSTQNHSVKAYLNGTEITSYNWAGQNTVEHQDLIGVNTSENSILNIHAPKGGEQQEPKWIVDELRVWNYPLTSEEIQSNLYGELQGTPSSLIGYWKFNEGLGDTLFNSAGSSNNVYINQHETPLGSWYNLDTWQTDFSNSVVDLDWYGPGRNGRIVIMASDNVGIAKYEFSLGTSAGNEDVVSWFSSDTNYVDIDLSSSTEGVQYFANGRVIDIVGYVSDVVSSDGFQMDFTTPIAGTVSIGDAYQADTANVTLTWSGFSDGLSGISHYEYGLGTQPGVTDIVFHTYVGVAESASITNLDLNDNTTYYGTVYAVDLVGNKAFATSSGVTVDISGPTIGTISDGGKTDLDWTNDSTSLTAYWIGFKDENSGIKFYEYAIGSSIGAMDVISWTNVGLDTSVTHSGLSLSGGKTYYFIVRATDLIGNVSSVATSDGIAVDVSPPTIRDMSIEAGDYVGSREIIFVTDEEKLAGSVTFTRTGGTEDAGSPHTKTIAGPTMIDNEYNGYKYQMHTDVDFTNLVDAAIYTVNFKVTDLADNQISIDKKNVIYDNTPPVSALLNPTSNSYTKHTKVSYSLSENTKSVMFYWNNTDTNSGDYFEIYVSGDSLKAGEHLDIELNPKVTDGQSYHINMAVKDLADNHCIDCGDVDFVTYDFIAPTVKQVSPLANSFLPITGNSKIRIDFSEPITAYNVDVSSKLGANLNTSIQQASDSLVISVNAPLTSLDTLTFKVTNLTDRGGTIGDPIQVSYQTSILADYNNDYKVDIQDLANFVSLWPNLDLGPANGTIPYLTPEMDGLANLRDVGIFTRMWHWSYANNGASSKVFTSIGEPITISLSSDRIIVPIPGNAIAGEILLEYQETDIDLGLSDEVTENRMVISNRDAVQGLLAVNFGYMKKTQNKELGFSVQHKGKSNSDFIISYVYYDENNTIVNMGTQDFDLKAIPLEYALHENYPNPFNPTTTLRFDLPEVSDITLTIYNMLGQRVRTFNMNDTPAGFHSIKWNATNDYGDPVGAGVYLYQLRANQYVKTRKMVLLK